MQGLVWYSVALVWLCTLVKVKENVRAKPHKIKKENTKGTGK